MFLDVDTLPLQILFILSQFVDNVEMINPWKFQFSTPKFLCKFLEEELSDIDSDFEFLYLPYKTEDGASLVTVTSTCEEYKETLISAINAITKDSFLAKCQANFLTVKKNYWKQMKWLFLGILLKITSSLCKMKFKVTIGVKNARNHTHSLYILLTVMELFHTILFDSSLMIWPRYKFCLWNTNKRIVADYLKKTFQL